MSQEERSREATGSDSGQVSAALGLVGLALVLFVVAIFVAQEENTWLWPVAGLVGLAAAITGWLGSRPKVQGRALLPVVAGGLIFVFVFVWGFVQAITGGG